MECTHRAEDSLMCSLSNQSLLIKNSLLGRVHSANLEWDEK